MSDFFFLPTESIAAGCQRVICEQLDDILEYMKQADVDEGVHQARKAFKRIRAALRMMRPLLADDVYTLENNHYRDTSRLLAPIRDHAVMIETLDTLTASYPNEQLHQTAQHIRSTLATQYAHLHHHLLVEQDTRRAVMDAVLIGKNRLLQWDLQSEGFAVAAEGIGAIYQQGAEQMQAAFADPLNAEKFHDWRKRVKYLWHQIQLLEPSKPEVLGVLVNDLKTLSDLLGLAHDLFVLRTHIRSMPEMRSLGGRTLLAKLDYEQFQQEAATHSPGEAIYTAQVDVFTAQLELYWSLWHKAE